MSCNFHYSVVSIRFDQVSHNVTEGDTITILIIADHIAVENISIILQLISLTASGNNKVAKRIIMCFYYCWYYVVNDYYYNDSISTVLVSGQWNTSVNISTVDDNIVELNESFILRIEQVSTTTSIFTQTVQPNSTLIEIIDNDGIVLNY